MTEVLMTTTYPYCEYGLAMVVIGLNECESYKSIRISIDKLNYIKTSIDQDIPSRTIPVMFHKLKPEKTYEIIAKIEYINGEMTELSTLCQPMCSEAIYPMPENYVRSFPTGNLVEGKVTLCSEQ